jgi:hypothetical protein
LRVPDETAVDEAVAALRRVVALIQSGAISGSPAQEEQLRGALLVLDQLGLARPEDG